MQDFCLQGLSIRIFFWTTCSSKILWGHLCKISVSGSFRTTCIGRIICGRSLHQDANLYQDPFGPLVPGSVGPLAPDLYQDAFGPLFWTTCIRISACARSLLEDLCIRILLGHLYEDPVGPLCKISVSGSCSTTCIRLL